MIRTFTGGALCASMFLASAAHAAGTPGADAPQNFPETADVKPARPILVTYPNEAAGEGASVNSYSVSRWAEDWTSKRDPKNRDDIFDRLKYLPITPDGDVYVTLSGEIRGRVNYQTNVGLRKTDDQRQDILRVVAGADVHIGKHLRVFGELATSRMDGINTGVAPTNQQNELVAQQYFVELSGEVAGTTMGVRYGRQEFTDGVNLMVSQRDNNGIRFVLNGARAWARTSNLRVDLFDLNFTRLGAGGLSDDRIDNDRRFMGMTAGYALPTHLFGKSKLYFDPFLWRLRQVRQNWGAVTTREVRDYAGARLWGSAGPFIVDWTVNHQFGKFGTRDIDATQMFLSQNMLISSKSPLKPRLGFHFDYATGSGVATDGTGDLGTAMAPFGNNIYYSYEVAFTPTNFIGVAPNLSVSATKNLKLVTEYQMAWRVVAGEPVYRGNGTPYTGTTTTGSREIGQVARLQAVWTPTPRLSFTGRYEHVFAGEALTRANYVDSDFLAGFVSWRF